MAGNMKQAMENYVQVKDRIKEFRDKHGAAYSLTTDLIFNDPNSCLFKAYIHDEAGRLVATGHSHEKKSDNPNVNITSMIENCETSAWGRALANFGMRIDKSIASKEEMSRVTKAVYEGSNNDKGLLKSVLRSLNVDNSMAKEIHEQLIKQRIGSNSTDMLRFIKEYLTEKGN